VQANARAVADAGLPVPVMPTVDLATMIPVIAIAERYGHTWA